MFYFFLVYDAEMHRKLWPEAPAKEGALGQMSKKFLSLLYMYTFFEKPNKKKIIVEPKMLCDILRYYYTCFSTIHCLLAKKKKK